MRASLFVTCLVDTFYPEVAESAVRVLRRHGVEVDFPSGQTCCGQVAFNSGFRAEAARVARRLVDALEAGDWVVTPSGSCAAMCRRYFSVLFQEDSELAARAAALNEKLFEFCEFLVRVLGVDDPGVRFPARAVYHPSCHMVRGLGVREEPLRLLRAVRALELVDLPYSQDCCGFGGTFAVKMGSLSEAMLEEKLRWVQETGARVIVGADVACLMHMAGRLRRLGSPVRVMHVAQVLDEGASGGHEG